MQIVVDVTLDILKEFKLLMQKKPVKNVVINVRLVTLIQPIVQNVLLTELEPQLVAV